MQYKILTVSAVSSFATNFERAASDLSQLVNQEILHGWKPTGGVAIGKTQSTREPYLFQAMIHD